MPDMPQPETDLDAIAASLRSDSSDITVFFQVLGAKLAESMPGSVKLEREGGMFKKQHPIKRITVTAGEDVFEAALDVGTIACRHSHAVRGITLRSEELALDAWLRALVGALAVQAQSSAQASAA